jgi:uncharacterized protein (TIGR02996 family)
MFDEAAFLQAIQANPADATAKLVYADWLDEHGEHERAEYVRLAARGGEAYQRQHHTLASRLSGAWLDLFLNRVPLWDPVTQLSLGHLNGLLAAFAMCSEHASDISYDFNASLRPRHGTLQEMADQWYGPKCQPVQLEPLDAWNAVLRQTLRQWLLMELGSITGGHGTRLALQTDGGRDGLVNLAMEHVAAVITPTAAWQVHITSVTWYACVWADLALEAPDRVLFLHFSTTD